MKARYLVCILISLALITPASAADVEGGVNVEPVIEETIFESLNHTVNTSDLDDWNITMTLNDAAYNNSTTFTLKTQICNNEGVCFAPSFATILTDDNKTFTSGVTTIEDHSYVNWRVTATYADDNTTEKFPASGFYKTWSDCWYNDGVWGGDGCPEPEIEDPDEKKEEAKEEKEDSDGMPALGIIATAGAIAIAAIIRYE